MAKSDQPITIKKYANRRLYNTGTSTYVTLEDLAARHVLLEAHDDEFGRGYRFSEEAVLPYLWILAAQQRFLEGRKAASAATDKPAVPTTDKAVAAAEKPTEKAAPAAVATPRAAGRP